MECCLNQWTPSRKSQSRAEFMEAHGEDSFLICYLSWLPSHFGGCQVVQSGCCQRQQSGLSWWVVLVSKTRARQSNDTKSATESFPKGLGEERDPRPALLTPKLGAERESLSWRSAQQYNHDPYILAFRPRRAQSSSLSVLSRPLWPGRSAERLQENQAH